MRLLVIGGTKFLGRHVVAAARARGHEVVLLHRGQTNAGLFAGDEGVREVLGDRTRPEDLARVAGERWDAVVDTCGYVPRVVRMSAQALRGKADLYVFVSSISVYADFPAASCDEDARVGELADKATEVVTGETYGPLKALCEAEAREAFGAGGALVVRPGLIVGPHDPTDRFTYWPRRAAAGGEALAPGDGTRLTQVIDVRDLAAWMVAAAEARRAGVFNLTGEAVPFRELLAACSAAAPAAGTRWTWVAEAFLGEQGVQGWTELPAWIAGQDQRVAIQRALDAGLRLRPLQETARDTLAWDAERGASELKAGLAAEKERAVLKAWRER